MSLQHLELCYRWSSGKQPNKDFLIERFCDEGVIFGNRETHDGEAEMCPAPLDHFIATDTRAVLSAVLIHGLAGAPTLITLPSKLLSEVLQTSRHALSYRLRSCLQLSYAV